MRIGIDVRCFAQGRNTGVEEYARGALRALFEVESDNEYILFFNAWRGKEIDFSWATKYQNVTLKKLTIPNKLLNLSLWLLQYPKLDKLCGGVDIFFMPNNNFCALSQNIKLLLTIHDLSFEHYKNSFSWKRRLWHFFVNPRLLAKKAEHIFVVSDATKTDVCETYNILENRITTVRSGMTTIEGVYDRNSMELITLKEKYHLPYKFILYFGTIEPRKNIVSIIKAFDEFRQRNKNLDYHLVIAGAKGWKGEEIYKAASEAKYTNSIKIIADVPEDEKEIFYTLASIFVYPSFFEGFGFPPLEALTCGVPVIVSNTTSLPEVVGKNAVMINPVRPDEIVEALTAITTDKKVQKILIKNAKSHVETFEWSTFANVFSDATQRIV